MSSRLSSSRLSVFSGFRIPNMIPAFGGAGRLVAILYAFDFVLAVILGGLGIVRPPSPQKESYLVFYADFIFSESERWLGYIFAFLMGGGLILALMGRLRAARRGRVGDGIRRNAELRSLLSPGRLSEILKLSIPVILGLILFSYVVGSINSINRFRLVDPRLADLDLMLTGGYPFLQLSSLSLPIWFTKAVVFSFVNLPFFLVLLAVLSFRKKVGVFSKYAVAFFTSIVLMIPLWLAVPVMSPQDRFIDNVYHLGIPERLETSLKNFQPRPEVESFMKQMRKSKAGLGAMPTTTFPSSHAAWATIACIYMFEVGAAAGALAAPFLILSTFGTFFLAQHYFVDAPAGILVGFISAVIASLIFRKGKGEHGGL